MYVSVRNGVVVNTVYDNTIGGGISYVGYAKQGTTQTEAGWTVQKIDESVTNSTVITAAVGGEFGAIWANRTSLTYN
jgi:catabolite regulation protein CreA